MLPVLLCYFSPVIIKIDVVVLLVHLLGTIQIEYCAYVTSTTMLLFLYWTFLINAWAHIYYPLRYTSVNQLESPLHLYTNNIICVELLHGKISFDGSKQMINWKGFIRTVWWVAYFYYWPLSSFIMGVTTFYNCFCLTDKIVMGKWFCSRVPSSTLFSFKHSGMTVMNDFCQNI